MMPTEKTPTEKRPTGQAGAPGLAARLAARLLAVPVLMWRWGVSPFLPPSCRFAPSCSQYALEALARHGAIEGSRLVLARLARCHPWGGHGYDPVPERVPARAGSANPEPEGR
jgi:putative membrane protein insertion efficiency factor